MELALLGTPAGSTAGVPDAAAEGGAAGDSARSPPVRFQVFISFKRSDAKDFARGLYNHLEQRGYSTFLEYDCREELLNVEQMVAACDNLIFILTDNVLDSYWCMAELAAAVRAGVNVVLVCKEGARWPDVTGKLTCEYPPQHLIEQLDECVQRTLQSSLAVGHSDEYYSGFCKTLCSRLVSPEKVAESRAAALARNTAAVQAVATLRRRPAAVFAQELTAATAAATRSSVFLAHKRSDAKDFARGLFTVLTLRGYSTCLDYDCREELLNVEQMVAACDNLIFILTDNVLDSYWCMAELAAAVRAGVNVVLVRKEGARWPDVTGKLTCEYPPQHLIEQLDECVQRTLQSSKAVWHSDEYYSAFCETLCSRLVSPEKAAESRICAAVHAAATPSALPAAVFSEELLGITTAAARFQVFLARKRTDAQDLARGLHTLLMLRGYTAFLEDEHDDEEDLAAVAAACDNMVFVLTDNVLASEHCMMELAAAVRNGVNVVTVCKEGARWPDEHGNYVLERPPPRLINRQDECVRSVLAAEPLKHSNKYYGAFADALINNLVSPARAAELRARARAAGNAASASRAETQPELASDAPHGVLHQSAGDLAPAGASAVRSGSPPREAQHAEAGSAVAVPADVAALLVRLSLFQHGPALCDRLGISCLEDMCYVTDAMLRDDLPTMRPVERAKLLKEVAPAPAPAPARRGTCDVFISYRVTETGEDGDRSVFALQAALQARGFSVFVGERAIQGGDEWPSFIQRGVRECKAFVVLCSPTYGETPWTMREFTMADNAGKPLLPVWHSGPWPPPAVEIYLSGKQRIPTGRLINGYVSADVSHERVAEELARLLVREGVKPGPALR